MKKGSEVALTLVSKKGCLSKKMIKIKSHGFSPKDWSSGENKWYAVHTHILQSQYL